MELRVTSRVPKTWTKSGLPSTANIWISPPPLELVFGVINDTILVSIFENVCPFGAKYLLSSPFDFSTPSNKPPGYTQTKINKPRGLFEYLQYISLRKMEYWLPLSWNTLFYKQLFFSKSRRKVSYFSPQNEDERFLFYLFVNFVHFGGFSPILLKVS